MTTSSHCNTGRMCVTLPIVTRENTSLAIHVAHPFSQIFNFLPAIRAPISAPSSDNFPNFSILRKGLYFAEKTLQTASRSPYKFRSDSTTHQSGRRPKALFSKNKQTNKLETKAMSLSRQCNTGRICVTLPIITTAACTRCSENHSNTCAENRKIRGLKFDTLYWRHLAAYRKI